LNRRQFVSVLGGVVAATASPEWGFGQGGAAAAKPPNIVLILSDDHSAEFLGCYGNEHVKTPNLDRFAAEGVRCDRAYVTSPQCVPSRASLMTGQSPVRIQMTRFSAALPLDVRTFPESLRAGGYHTGLCGRTFHLDGSRLPPESQRVFEKYELKTFPRRMDYVRSGGRRLVPAQVREFLDGVPAGKPFFLQVGFDDPHRPFNAPKVHDPQTLTLPPHFPDTPGVRRDLAAHYDEIARLDADVGDLLKTFETRGLTKDTLFVFMGDNGGALLHGKGTLYELGIRVPLLLRWAGVVRPGSTTDALISGEDIATTLLEAAGIPAPKEMQGRSFLPLLRGQPSDKRRYVFAERGAHGSGLPDGSAAFDLGRCVVSPTHKLIYNALWQIPYEPVDFGGNPFWKDLKDRNARGELPPEVAKRYFAPQRKMFELYDLAADPYERRDISGQAQHAETERALKAALQEWMILNRDYVPLPVPPPPQGR